jgi:hypothetical protein
MRSAAIRHSALGFGRLAERLPGFERRTLLAWAPADRFFRFSFAERLLACFPTGRLERVEDAATGSRADAPDDLGSRVLQSVLTALRLLVDGPHIVETV